VNQKTAWERRLNRWLEPFESALGHKRRRGWAPLYVQGLLLPGDRKSLLPISQRVAPDDKEQLHHFIAASPWDSGPVEDVLCEKVDALLGGPEAHLIVDDTALPKKGAHSVGVSHQYCGALGKQSNCQCLVSLTLSRDDNPAPIGLRLYLPQSWAKDRVRCKRAKVPASILYRPKWQIALDEIDRIRKNGTRFGDVLADAGYGMCAEFRHGLDKRELLWAVGILRTQNVYDPGVETFIGATARGRPRTRPLPSEAPCSAEKYVERHGTFRAVTWRSGTKGKLKGDFATVRVRVADGAETRNGVHLPGQPAWLICERRSDELKYYLSNFPANASLLSLVRAIKARWACELAHQQMKEELGLDHFEGRSWTGLHHHTVMTMIAFAFLQTLRTSENKPPA
jgi:SRSO17 transposase